MTAVLQFNPVPQSIAPEIVGDTVELAQRFADLAGDESNLPGEIPGKVSLAKRWEDVAACLAFATRERLPVVIAGAQTGLAGGALGRSDALTLSTRGISYITRAGDSAAKAPRLRVGAGTTLQEVQEYIAEHLPEFWFPVDPTETSASMGGLVAVGAAGARSYSFGSIRNWVEWIRLVRADGMSAEIRRGEIAFSNATLAVKSSAEEQVLTLQALAPLPQTKAAVGFPLAADMDAIDLFIGSEGTLGVITDIELRLAPRPPQFLYVLQFFEDEEQGIEFVSALDSHPHLQPLALEYCDAAALRLIEKCSRREDSRAIQHITAAHQAAVFIEFAADSADALDETLVAFLELVASHSLRETDCIAGSEPRDIRDMKVFRHAIPETINALIRTRRADHPGIHKLALDMAVPREKRAEVFRLYKQAFSEAGFEFSIFGHAGDAHFHVNIMARDEAELLKAKALYADLAKTIVEMGGTVAAEHGIGKLKKQLLTVQHRPETLAAFSAVKRCFDPQQLLSQGVLV